MSDFLKEHTKNPREGLITTKETSWVEEEKSCVENALDNTAEDLVVYLSALDKKEMYNIEMPRERHINFYIEEFAVELAFHKFRYANGMEFIANDFYNIWRRNEEELSTRVSNFLKEIGYLQTEGELASLTTAYFDARERLLYAQSSQGFLHNPKDSMKFVRLIHCAENLSRAFIGLASYNYPNDILSLFIREMMKEFVTYFLEVHKYIPEVLLEARMKQPKEICPNLYGETKMVEEKSTTEEEEKLEGLTEAVVDTLQNRAPVIKRFS